MRVAILVVLALSLPAAAITSLGNGSFRAVIDEGYDYRGIEIADAAKPDKGEIAIGAVRYERMISSLSLGERPPCRMP